MKVIFRDESPICFGQGYDAGTLVWCRSNETKKDDEDENEHISSITDDMGLMSGKGPGKMAASTSGNAQVDSFWTLFLIHQSKGGLVMLSSFFRMMMHLSTEKRGFKPFFRKDILAQ